MSTKSSLQVFTQRCSALVKSNERTRGRNSSIQTKLASTITSKKPTTLQTKDKSRTGPKEAKMMGNRCPMDNLMTSQNLKGTK